MAEPTITASPHAPPIAVDAPPVKIDPRARMQIYGAILLGLFLAALDNTVVGTALPKIATDLRGNELFTAVFTAYLLTATVSGPIYGKLSDLYGRRPIMLFGVGLFLVGSLLSGLSQEMWQLVLFRGVQGLGAGALFPIALAVVGDLFSPAERGKYSGLLGAVFGLAAVIGPAVGGILTDTIGWQWVFFINLPLGAVVLAVIWRLLPRIKGPEGSRSIDYLGAAVFSAAVVAVLVGFTNMLTRLWEAERPRAVLVGWDSLGEPTYRIELFPDYQGGREFDDELLEQLDLLPAVVEAFGFTPLIGVLSVMADKDVEGVLTAFEPVMETVVCTQNSTPRAMPAADLAAAAVEVFGADRVEIAPRLDDAIDAACRLAESGDTGAVYGQGGVLVTGSVITAGEARTLLARR